MSARANRVALVGPSHVLGADLKDRLASAGYPGDAVELLDLDEHVGLLTEYGDEARVVLEAADEAFAGFEVVCFCSDAPTTARFAPAAAAAGTAIDCTGVMSRESDVQLVGADGSPDATGLLAIPQSATLMLAKLGEAVDLTGASCSITLPASDLCDAGTEEMAKQASALLNLGDAPDEVFGRRLAFDLWLDVTRPDGASGRIRAELEQLGVQPPAIHAQRGSVFHGLAASIYFPDAKAAALTEALESVAEFGALTGANDAVDSPVRVAGLDGLHVAAVRDDPAGGAWLWSVMDNHRATTAATLTAIATRLGRPA